MAETPAQLITESDFAARTKEWLAAVGLQFNPFAADTLNASADFNLGQYLVGHDDFAALWGDWTTTILAPTGGGKSAFCVRLAYAARIGEDGRRVFPVTYSLPRQTNALAAHLEALAENAAYELLLEVAYRPRWFESLSPEIKDLIRQTLDQNAPGWTRFLIQLEREGSIAPLAETFDRTALRLPNSPGADGVRQVCAALRAIPVNPQTLPLELRWRQLIDLLIGDLQFEAVYLLVDGADAYPETVHNPDIGLRWLSPLLEQTDSLSKSRIYLKLFLPIELEQGLRRFKNLLTLPARFVKINWTVDRLAEVLAARMRVASGGEFDSLDAISSPALRGLNRELANTVRPPIPREAVVLAGRIIFEHVRRPNAGELLEVEDLEAARDWYRRDRLMVRSS
jgi:hypothetical protein